MWYFAWILGVCLAVLIGVLNVMWYEAEQHYESVAVDQKKEQRRKAKALQDRESNLLGKLLFWLYRGK